MHSPTEFDSTLRAGTSAHASYSDVDENDVGGSLVVYQASLHTNAGVRAYKRRTYDLLASCRPVLDLGCGPGIDLEALDSIDLIGSAVGVDESMAMCRHARLHSDCVARASGARLPFPDSAFGGARIDRVLVHVSDPVAVIDEVLRVVSDGGSVVVAETDLASLVLHVEGLPESLLARVRDARRELAWVNGDRAAMIRQSVAERLDCATIEEFPIAFSTPNDVLGLRDSVARFAVMGASFSDHDVAVWESGIDAAEADGFRYEQTCFVMSGKRRS